jgi:hypothetical protein
MAMILTRRFSQIWLQETYESKTLKTFLNIFGCIFKPFTKTWRFFLNFDQTLAIENLKKHLILAPFFI